MDLNKIKMISFSLLKMENDMGKGTAEYTKKLTAKFDVPENFPRDEQMFEELVKKMYNDLTSDAREDADSLGLWIEYDNTILENAISLRTLDDIQQYSAPGVNNIYEFFKMTFME
jgi:hypothetical protein